MRNSHRGTKVMLAVLASVAALVSMAAPSAAATTNVTWDLTGHITTQWDGATRILNDPTGTTICVPAASGNPTVVTHVDDATHTTHINSHTAWAGFDPADINIAGTNYRVQVRGATTLPAGTSITSTGSFNPTTDTFSQTVFLAIDIRNCAGTTLLCTFPVAMTMTGHNYDGGTLPATGNSVTLTGTTGGITPYIGCNAAIRSWILGTTASATFHLTAH